jgi:DDE family transposase
LVESLRALILSSLKPVLCNGFRGSARRSKEWWPLMAKRLSRSHDRAAGKKALHPFLAWAVENRLVLAQLATEEQSNEITAIPLLLHQLALAGCIVTIDAMGTQTKIAEQIIEQEGEYALALKDNQGNLYEEVKATFAATPSKRRLPTCRHSRIVAWRRGMDGWKSESTGP